ncbi:hypothetical protein BDW22DRAFT_1355085 [Trametopsis cervina]|nr:hypothetical protein BDW22DRAFT_1355085 [Trametopsis cervina]
MGGAELGRKWLQHVRCTASGAHVYLARVDGPSSCVVFRVLRRVGGTFGASFPSYLYGQPVHFVFPSVRQRAHLTLSNLLLQNFAVRGRRLAPMDARATHPVTQQQGLLLDKLRKRIHDSYNGRGLGCVVSPRSRKLRHRNSSSTQPFSFHAPRAYW